MVNSMVYQTLWNVTRLAVSRWDPPGERRTWVRWPAGPLRCMGIETTKSLIHWPWLRNRLIGGTYNIYKAKNSGLCKGIYPQNMAKNMVITNVPPSVGSWNSHWYWLDDRFLVLDLNWKTWDVWQTCEYQLTHDWRAPCTIPWWVCLQHWWRKVWWTLVSYIQQLELRPKAGVKTQEKVDQTRMQLSKPCEAHEATRIWGIAVAQSRIGTQLDQAFGQLPSTGPC